MTARSARPAPEVSSPGEDTPKPATGAGRHRDGFRPILAVGALVVTMIVLPVLASAADGSWALAVFLLPFLAALSLGALYLFRRRGRG
ncbi:MAG: hypothetical protein ACRDGU_03920 [Actinomycetota bacterium]